MIRNVVVGRIRADVPAEQVEAAVEALRNLTVEGLDFEMITGHDLGLRPGNADFALTVDIPDEESYRIYDADPEHNRIRAELFGPISEDIMRIQFRLP